MCCIDFQFGLSNWTLIFKKNRPKFGLNWFWGWGFLKYQLERGQKKNLFWGHQLMWIWDSHFGIFVKKWFQIVTDGKNIGTLENFWELLWNLIARYQKWNWFDYIVIYFHFYVLTDALMRLNIAKDLCSKIALEFLC